MKGSNCHDGSRQSSVNRKNKGEEWWSESKGSKAYRVGD
jgi:hypothetical protein